VNLSGRVNGKHLIETTVAVSTETYGANSGDKALQRLDDYIPFPFNEATQPILQAVQLFLPLLGTLAAIVHAYLYGFALGTIFFAFLLGLITLPGIAVGIHRLFTHRSFETTRPIRALFAVLGSMAGQDNLFLWVCRHRQHHQFTDREGDPHTPVTASHSALRRFRAFVRIQLTWTLSNRMTEEHLRYMPDLTADPMLCRIQRSYLFWIGLGYLLPAAACYAITPTLQAAVGGFLWGGCVRTLFTTQMTNVVNSVCHLWGARPFDSADGSRNNRAVAWITMGEGWHNNHHAFPASARHGLEPGEFDLSWSIIRLLERRGLAWNVKTPTTGQIAEKRRPS
jgi:stearoyl-CoA desaturase (Delta-9 desaturase)